MKKHTRQEKGEFFEGRGIQTEGQRAQHEGAIRESKGLKTRGIFEGVGIDKRWTRRPSPGGDRWWCLVGLREVVLLPAVLTLPSTF